MPFKILFLLALVSGCAPSQYTVHVADGAPGWVNQITYDAVDWWSGHGADIAISDTGTLIDLGVFPSATKLGEFQTWTGADDRIVLAARMQIYVESGEPYATRFPVCVVAHEMGHMMGMEHVEDTDSLLSPIIHMSNNDCLWSQYDQAEYDRM